VGTAIARIYMGIVEDRFGEAACPGTGRTRFGVGDEALAAVPAVVAALTADHPRGRARGDVDLLTGVLPNVGDHHRPADAVKGETPGIPQSVAPDLRFRARARFEAEDLAEQAAEVLPAFERIAATGSGADRDV